MVREKPYPGFWNAALLCAVFVSAQMAGMAPAGVIDAFLHLHLSTNPLVLGLANIAGCAVVLVVARAIGRVRLSDACTLGPVSPAALCGVVVASAGSIVLLSEVDNLFRLIVPMPESVARIFQSIFSREDHLWMTAFLLIIVAPITEEIMFRGLILRGFLRRFSLWKAFLLSSILFGATHLNPWQFVSASLLGVLFAWWYARTRSLIPSLLGHFLVNSAVVIAPRLPFEIRGFNEGAFQAVPQLQPLWLDGIGILSMLIGIWLFRSGSEPIPEPLECEANTEAGLPPVIATTRSSTPDSTNS